MAPHATWRLSGLRRRKPGLPVVHPDDDRGPGRRQAGSGPIHQGRAGNARSDDGVGAGTQHAGRAHRQHVQRPRAQLNCLTACAASSQAIGEATEIIRRGDADVMISGGAHSMIHPFGVTGFNLLTALSTRNDEPTEGLPPVRPHARRLRPGRRRRHGRARRARARQGAAAPRSTARSSATARRPTPTASPTSTPRAAARSLHADGHAPTPGSTRTISTTSTPTAPAPR